MNSNNQTTLLQNLFSLRSDFAKNKAFWGFWVVLALGLGLGFLGIWVNSLFVFPIILRIAFLGIYFLLIISLFSFLVLRNLIHKPSLENLAKKLEQKFPQLENRLIAALQLQKHFKANPEGYSLDMIEAVIAQAERICSQLELNAIIDKGPLRKISKVTLSLATIFLIFALIFPANFKNSIYLFSHPLTAKETVQKFSFEINPGNTEVVKFSDFKVKIKVIPLELNWNKEKLEKINLFWKNEGGSWNKEELNRLPQDNSIASEEQIDFSHTFREVKRNFEYYAQSQDVESEKFLVRVVDKPRIVDLRLTYNYPAYTQLKKQVIEENDGNINALIGTKVEVFAKANQELSSAFMVFSDTSKKEMKVAKEKAVGEILVKKDMTYHIEVYDQSKNKNPDPIEYKITTKPDQYPEIEILEPGQDLDLNESMTIGLLMRISDDYGFSSLKLHYTIISNEQESPEKIIKIDLTSSEIEQKVNYLWNLSQETLIPGDLIRYFAEIWDNDTFSGPKKAQSKSYTLRFPTLDEIVKEVQEEQEGQVMDLEQVLKSQKELSQKLKELSLEMQKETKTDWEKRKEIENLLSKQKNLAEELKEIGEQLENTTQKMEENKLVSMELVQKLMELKKLFEEVATPEMKQAMQKLQQALENMDQEQLRKALENMKISQEEMLKKLERTLALLKKLQAEQKLDALIKRTEELANQQKEINQQTEQAKEEKLKELSPRENSLEKDVENLEKALKDFSQEQKKSEMLPKENLQELSEYVEKSEVKKDMSDMTSQLSSGEKKQAKNSGEKASSKLFNLAQKLRETKNTLNAEQKEKIVKQMKKSLNDLLYLSENQEELYNQTNQNNPGEQSLRDLAPPQKNLEEGVAKVEKEVEELSQETFILGLDLSQTLSQAINNLEQAVNALSQKNKGQALSSQVDGNSYLNSASRTLLDAIDQAKSSCSGGSNMDDFFEKLSSMCNKQGEVNAGTQGMAGLLSSEQAAAMQRLAAEQEALRKSVDELNREFGNRSEILGDLNNLSAEMKKVVDDLENKDVGEGTVLREKKILSRLLDAEKSLQKKDFSEKRKAETGENLVRKSPKELPQNLAEQDKKTKQELDKFLEEGYPKAYQELILEYFKAVSQIKQK
jgi:hypothetical protein